MLRALRTSFLLPAVLVLASGCKRAPAPAGAPDAAPSASHAPAASPIPAASLSAALNPERLPPYQGPTGSVEGTVSVTGPAAATVEQDYKLCADGAKTYGHAFREGTPATPDAPRPLADAVVGVTGYSKFWIPETKEARETVIRDCAYDARTVVLTYGQRLEVKNATKTFWTPELEPAQMPLTMMATPGGEAVKLYPKKPGHYTLRDHDRRWVLVDVYVSQSPLHAVSGLDGRYRIDGVPAGKLRVHGLHPRIRKAGVEVTVEQELEVKAGETAHVDLVIPNPGAEGASAKDAGSPRDAGHPR